MTLNERIKELRKQLSLTQDEFARRLGVTRGVITNIEFDKTTPKDQFVSLICREFGVSQAWLVDGEGEMFVARSRNEEIALVVNSIMAESDDSFRKRFLAMICDLSPAQWELLHDFIKKLTRDP